MDVGRIRKYAFQQIGTWNSSAFKSNNTNSLLLNRNSRPQFGIESFGNVIYKPTMSECGRCRLGEYHEPVQSSCCGTCKPCLGQMYSNDSVATACRNCSTTGQMWGNNPFGGSTQLCGFTRGVSLFYTSMVYCCYGGINPWTYYHMYSFAHLCKVLEFSLLVIWVAFNSSIHCNTK